LYELPDFCPLSSPDLNTFISKYGAASLLEKVQDVNDLSQNLIDARVGVEQSVIDDGSDKWCRRLHAWIRASPLWLCSVDRNLEVHTSLLHYCTFGLVAANNAQNLGQTQLVEKKDQQNKSKMIWYCSVL